MGFLARLLHSRGSRGKAKGTQLQILSLQALAHAAQGDTSLALAPLARALALAEPEGFVRVFVDEGPPMAALLQAVPHNTVSPRTTWVNYGQPLGRLMAKRPSRSP